MTWGSRTILFSAALLWGGLLAVFTEVAFGADTITSTVSSNTVTVDKTPNTASAPSVVISNQDTCVVAATGAIQSTVIGFAGSTTHEDQLCQIIKLSRRLSADGLRTASVALLAQDPRVFKALWMAGVYPPYRGAIGEKAKEGWINNLNDLPKGVSAEWLESDSEYYERTGISREQAKLNAICAKRGYTFDGDPCRNN
jgi:hypothetical protein